MKDIKFYNVCKSYGTTNVIENLNMTIKAGERLVVLGPSGCGKTTLLRMIAGLESITSGDLIMGDRKVNHIASGERNVAMVFQNYALYPHMTVKDNIQYGMKIHKIDSHEIEKRYKKAIELLELEDFVNRKPRELSGGQRQRVALARALVKRSDYFLLDEPLSNLDAQLRVAARKGLVDIHNMFKQTFIYVTHDQTEAMTIGHRIALFNKGKLQMLATPNEIYNFPKNVFTAKFIGSPSMNIIEGNYEYGNIYFGENKYVVHEIWNNLISEKSSSDSIYLGIRPEDVKLSRAEEKYSLKGVVRYIENYGNKEGVYIDLGVSEIIAITENSEYQYGSEIYVVLNPYKIHIFDGKTLLSLGCPDLVKEKISVA
ncbi:ABC transporter ATP-binding protein [Tepidanaerobacter acetatoxydans]|jgi:ABC-type sugar transport system ATPase subunit|uniref:ABC transporter ATP-binding protein n=1 Tax=Tepidanaerobacter acetatoxydans TaxID=499229 RepID=UPI001BD47869|nr:ABC transporter ATP-binding protein [Tepidanaerobacter acetatoxydans]